MKTLNKDNNVTKRIKYSDIKQVSIKPYNQEDMIFKFIVYTTDRVYTLYADCLDDYCLWCYTFKWIVECNYF